AARYGHLRKDTDVGRVRAERRQRGDDVSGEDAGGVVLRARPVELILARKRNQRDVDGRGRYAINIEIVARERRRRAFAPPFKIAHVIVIIIEIEKALMAFRQRGGTALRTNIQTERVVLYTQMRTQQRNRNAHRD